MTDGTILRSPRVRVVWIVSADGKEVWRVFIVRKGWEYSFTDCMGFVV